MACANNTSRFEKKDFIIYMTLFGLGSKMLILLAWKAYIASLLTKSSHVGQVFILRQRFFEKVDNKAL